jgi:small subunit ribosomal protein S26e
MVKKRRSGGHTGTSGGRDATVTCSSCGRLTPRGKAKRITRRVSLVDATIERELRDSDAILPTRFVEEWYCVSCAIHQHKVHIRANDERKNRDRLR